MIAQCGLYCLLHLEGRSSLWVHVTSEAALGTEGGVIKSFGLDEVCSMIRLLWAVQPQLLTFRGHSAAVLNEGLCLELSRVWRVSELQLQLVSCTNAAVAATLQHGCCC